uniref:NADH dehydrogenase subunit 6 n=1 Tax=Parasagitta elegans TaxID=1562708 RepID=A0A141CL88_9BILA|nr:NADH dehydrogenase subunit 6 [Parasagitta elegans]AKS04284.1 NADH dehydrogenase subunit 6 [Parasagitta elegans]AKS04380.1 NADH dehydrogenase subunit 6 [Parasagitta elegans]
MFVVLMFASTPLFVAFLFVVLLLMTSLTVSGIDSFLGLIVFVVYVGGALVLFSYCFMLTPLQDSVSYLPKLYLPLLLLTVNSEHVVRGSLYEFYWVSSMLVGVGVLLFIVMLSVVSLIDISDGAMRVL